VIVVFDTRVVVSAVLRDRDPEAVMLHVVQHPEFTWVASAAIVAEYLEVLSRPKFAIPKQVIARWRRAFAQNITQVDPVPDIVFPRDSKDAKFIACALAAQAGFLVTGDQDFEEARRLLHTRIVSVAQFKRLFSIKL
jgi:uncharacterized protein